MIGPVKTSFGTAIVFVVLSFGMQPPAVAECTVRPGDGFRYYLLAGETRKVTVTCAPEDGSCTATAFSDDSSPTLTFIPDDPTVPGGSETVVDGSATFTLAVSAVAEAGEDESVFVSLSCSGGALSNARAPTTSASIDTNIVVDRTRGATDSALSAGDPISTFTGELYNLYPADLDLGGPMPLSFRRYYASRLLGEGHITGSLGNNWLHEFEWTLTSTPATKKVVTNRGRVITFVLSGSSWVPRGRKDIPFRSKVNGTEFIVSDPRVNRMYTFDDEGRLIEIADGKGNVHTLTYSNGRLTEIDDGLGRTLSLGYDGNGHLSQVSDLTRTVTFEHLGDDLTVVTDVSGQATTFSYEGGGRMISSTTPVGDAPFTQAWNVDGQVVTQADAAGHVTTLEYASNQTTITTPNGESRVHFYEGGTDFLSASQDQAGQTVVIASDFNTRRGAITDRLGDTTFFTYDGRKGTPASRSNPDGSTTTWNYATKLFVANLAMYRPFRVTHADGTREELHYDSKFNVLGYTDQEGWTSSATYNSSGQPLTITNAAGGVASLTYNADGTLRTIESPAGSTTTIDYDALKRPNGIVWEDGNTRGRVLDDNDRVLSVTDENGQARTADYDANGRLVTLTRSLSETLTFAYDGNDRILGVTDPLGHTFATSYDTLGRPQTLTDTLGNVTTLGYDSLGRLVTVTDPLGHVLTRTHDAESVIASVTDPLGNTTTFESDSMGRTTKRTTPLGSVTEFGYDVNGRVVTIADPLQGTTTLGRNSRGRLSGVALAGGAIAVTHQRNALGQITDTTDPNGNVWQFAYDDQGRRVSRTDPLGRSVDVTYDVRDREQTITYPAGMGALTIGRDPVGNVTALNWSDGTALTFGYDANNRFVSGTGIGLIRDANGRIVNSNGIGMVRDARGLITSMTLAAGKTVNYDYDAAGRLVQVSDWIGGISGFVHDASGRLIEKSRPNGIDTTFSHDDDGRLVGISEGAMSEIALTRDAMGQITGVARTAPVAASAAGVADLVKTYDAASQTAGDAYDALGRCVAVGGDSFVWNLASRLSNYTVDGSTVQASYDALGQRLTRTMGETTRSFVWNAAIALPAVSIEREGGVDRRYFIHTPGGRLLYSVDAVTNVRHFYHFDEMGNTLIVTDDAGAVVAGYAYSPYGLRTTATGDLSNPFTWQGEFGVVDEGNGIYYARARYYDSRTARFLSRDPLRSVHPKKVNPYQYANLNPLRFVDRSGLDPELYETGLQNMEPVDLDLDLDAAYSFGFTVLFKHALDALPNVPAERFAEFLTDLQKRYPEAVFGPVGDVAVDIDPPPTSPYAYLVETPSTVEIPLGGAGSVAEDWIDLFSGGEQCESVIPYRRGDALRGLLGEWLSRLLYPVPTDPASNGALAGLLEGLLGPSPSPGGGLAGLLGGLLGPSVSHDPGPGDFAR